MRTLTTFFALMLIFTANSQNIFVYQTESSEIILMSEGQREGRLDILIDATQEMITEVAPRNTYSSAINVFMIRTKSGKNILIDTGLGHELFNNLEKIKITTEAVDAVLITHLHGDHIGGLLHDEKKGFQNAKLMMPKREAESANENALKMIALNEGYHFFPLK